MRINKFLSSCGIASRRKSDVLLLEGRVMVNGIIIDELGYQVNPDVDEVRVDGQIIKQNKPVYYKLYKPEGFISTVKDDKNRQTVMDFFPDLNLGLFPVGRLDRDSEGLIIVTNDGDLAHRLMHPRYNVQKVYEVIIDKKLSDKEVSMLANGIRLDEGITSKCHVEITNEGKNFCELLFIIHQGWYRQIRRMVEKIGANVTFLRRTFIDSISLAEMKIGERKKLTNEEVKALKKCVNLI